MSFQGKMKAVTFSFDDGVTQDRRLVEMFNQYGLRGTFNINSGKLSAKGFHGEGAQRVTHDKIDPEEIATLYVGHEVAAHTVTHPHLYDLSDDELVRQCEEDRLTLEKLSGGSVVGMAYPFGDVDDRIIDVLGKRTGIRYSRTTIPTWNFELPEEPLRLDPTLHAIKYDRLMELGQQFIDLKSDRPQLFYIWGHAYEFDRDDGWNKFEEFCKLISGHDDIAYLTNREALNL